MKPYWKKLAYIIGWLIVIMILFFLTSCTVDPRKEAQAYQIRTEANQNAADDTQARQQSQDLHDAEVQRLADEAERREALQGFRIAVMKWFWTSLGIALVFTVLASGYSLSKMSYGLSLVAVEAASLKANLIYLDKSTRQFPILRQVHNDKYVLHNPNTGSNIMLDMSIDADRQMIAAMGMVQLAGALAQEARQSSDPGAMMMFEPKTVHAQEDGLYIGDHYIANPIPLPGDSDDDRHTT